MSTTTRIPGWARTEMSEQAIAEAVAIIVALPDKMIVQMMDDMEDDIYETSDRVADFFHSVLTPPPWYVDSSSRHPHTGQPYYGPGADDLCVMADILGWLHSKGITTPAALLMPHFDFRL